MKTQVTEVLGLSVYTDKAVFVGDVDDVVIDLDGKKIKALALGNLNLDIVDIKGYKGLQIPYRMIRSIGDIILIRHMSGVFKQTPK
ncbi:PRC-barrel domain-containing protein [Methanosphaerula palustris]|jgi:sporulation protein YlmC with PRC-barrel domain|uniref:PRC-barrel domain protein n=1 Tax=Methanosphaerula palustris (strain ATCC BAA-1556 / DSM 19958 / E1-9c) TaxID=521011 RepID=B8GIX0_METPE|nr:PRC-barrel domain-containing protein [Methanosphaerula palustris]ACL15543.1 PRC-barrel domain protein [Methanosphaerula palustris E1-9c]